MRVRVRVRVRARARVRVGVRVRAKVRVGVRVKVRVRVRVGVRVSVAQLVPRRGVRVVRGAYRVEVEPLHQRRVGQHVLPRDGLATVRAVLVPIDAAHRERRAVDAQQPLPYAHRAQPHPSCLDVDHGALAVAQLQDKRVQERRLGRPQLGRGQPRAEARTRVGSPQGGPARRCPVLLLLLTVRTRCHVLIIRPLSRLQVNL
jgi:hypothetical protein